MAWLPQYGHAPGGLLVCGAAAGRSGERDIGVWWDVQGAYHRPRILEDEVTSFGRPPPIGGSRIVDGGSADAVADFARNGSGF